MKLNRREIIGTGTYLCEFHIVVEPVGALLCIIKTDGSAARQPHYLSITELYLEQICKHCAKSLHQFQFLKWFMASASFLRSRSTLPFRRRASTFLVSNVAIGHCWQIKNTVHWKPQTVKYGTVGRYLPHLLFIFALQLRISCNQIRIQIQLRYR